MHYRTEIYVTKDRYVCLQLPDYVPEGRAVITVMVEGPDAPGSGPSAAEDLDREDIEWWEEFDGGEPGRHP